MLTNRSDAQFFYQFEKNVNDSLGLNNGTVNGTAVYVNSTSGQAFDFNGSTQIDTGVSALDNTKSFSIMLRGDFNNLTSDHRLVSYQQLGSNVGWILRYGNTASDFQFYLRDAANSGWYLAAIADTTLPANAVYAIHAYWDKGTEIGLQIYKSDGTLLTNTVATTDTSYSTITRNVVIGSDSNTSTPAQYHDGQVDDCLLCIGNKLTSDDFYGFYMGQGVSDL